MADVVISIFGVGTTFIPSGAKEFQISETSSKHKVFLIGRNHAMLLGYTMLLVLFRSTSFVVQTFLIFINYFFFRTSFPRQHRLMDGKKNSLAASSVN